MVITAQKTMQRILVVDDESSISELISTSLRFVGFDVRTAANGAQALAMAAGSDYPITVEVPSELHILGDSDRIYQVFTNLIANARTHTPVGTAITITARAEDDGAYVTVADNGPGLSEPDQKKIFERFSRADPSRQRNDSKGSGLGLSTVDAVMAAHGEKVGVVSKPGHGDSFTLFFPRIN